MRSCSSRARRAIERQHAQRMVSLFTHAPVGDRGAARTGSRLRAGQRAVSSSSSAAAMSSGKPIREALPELAGQGIFELLDRVRLSGEPFVGQSVHVTLNRGPRGDAEDAYFDFVYQPVFDEDGRVDSIVVVAHDVTALAIGQARGGDRQPAQGRVPGHALARAAHAAQRGARLHADAARRRDRAGAPPGGSRDDRAQRQAAGTAGRAMSSTSRASSPASCAWTSVRSISRGSFRTRSKRSRRRRPPRACGCSRPSIGRACPVAGDAQRLQQVVWNLLSNAVKFTPRGGRVQVRLQRVDSHVEITVSDTGEGIAPEFLPHLFQRFTQADGRSRARTADSAWGWRSAVTWSRRTADSIEAMSPGKGQGTTVRVRAAADDRARRDSRGRAGPRAPDRRSLPSHGPRHSPNLAGIRVLLVDDDADALQMAKDALTFAGATVFTRLERRRRRWPRSTPECFDVAVLDIGMPEVDGYQLLKQHPAATRDRQGQIPIAALTAYARSSIARGRSRPAFRCTCQNRSSRPNSRRPCCRSPPGRARRPSASQPQPTELGMRGAARGIRDEGLRTKD